MQQKLITLLVLILWSWSSTAQKEANWWYFGRKAGLNFNVMTAGLPQVRANGALNTIEGCATISDRRGNLLFYTDGQTVWNNAHTVMPNGNGLLARGNNTAQSALIVPKPGTTHRYFVFTCGFGGRFTNAPMCYSEVDMTLQNGLGDVLSTTKNTVLFRGVAGRITATEFSGTGDYWVITQKADSAVFHAYRVSAIGVNTTPVVSRFPAYNNVGNNFQGYMKASPNGKRIALARQLGTGGVWLMDFDARTGRLSNLRTHQPGKKCYGVEFSPNSSKLYVSLLYGDTIMQYDANAPNSAAFAASANRLWAAAQFGSRRYRWVGAMQLAPNGKIYFVHNNKYSQPMGVIHHPNNNGVAASISANGPLLPIGSQIEMGLPNFIPSFLNPDRTRFLIEDQCLGRYTKITLKDTLVADSVQYFYGDPTSGVANTSWNKLDSHLYSTPGRYFIKAHVYQTYNATVLKDTLYDTLDIILKPRFTLGNDTNVCPGDTIWPIQLVNTPSNLLWIDSTKFPFFVVDSVGEIWLTASNHCGRYSDTVKINHILKDTLNFGNDTVICAGDSLVLNMTDAAATYLWNNGTKKPKLKVDTTGQYWGELTNLCGTVYDTIQVTLEHKPRLDLGKNRGFCKGKVFLLPSQPVPTVTFWRYSWQDGSIGRQHWVRAEGLKSVRVANKCGVFSDSVYIWEDLPLQIDLGPDTTLCDGKQLRLDPLTKGASCNWSDGKTDSAIYVSSTGKHWVEATNACGVYSDTIKVQQLNSLKVELSHSDTIICSKDTIRIQVNNTASSAINWSHGPTNNSVQLHQPGVYKVTVTNICGTASGQIQIDTLGVPRPDLGMDTVICSNIPLRLDPMVDVHSKVLWNDGSQENTLLITQAGDYQVHVQNKCGKAQDDIKIAVEHLPQIDLGPDTKICHEEEFILSTGLKGKELKHIKLIWQGEIESNEFRVRKSGYYILSARNRCGVSKDSIWIERQPELLVGAFMDTNLCPGQLTYDFRKLPYTFEWEDGATSDRYTIHDPGEYGFTMKDTVGCTRSVHFEVKACAGEWYVPNAFSPNGNSDNEGFRIYKAEIYDFHLVILNRWNEVIFETYDITEKWNGRRNNTEGECPVGTYIWKASYREAQNRQSRVKMGEINLIR